MINSDTVDSTFCPITDLGPDPNIVSGKVIAVYISGSKSVFNT
jgi:hypothetical protein